MPAFPPSFRRTFEGRDCLLRGLRTLGRARIAQARTPGLAEHVHPTAFEIFLIERGEARWWVENESHRLVAGDIYVNRPGERHGSIGTSLRPCAYCWLQLAVKNGRLPGLDARQSSRLIRALSDRRVRSFPASPVARAHFMKLWEIHAAPGPEAEIRARAHLHILLIELADCIEKHATSRRCRTFSVRAAVRTIEADPGQDHSVPILASRVHLGLTQFNARFLAETGFTPADYVRRRRIELAKDRLQAGGIAITALAADLGFSSSQHFATTFKKFEGMTPSEFRRQVNR